LLYSELKQKTTQLKGDHSRLTEMFILMVCPSLNPRSNFGPFCNSCPAFCASVSCFRCL